MDVTHLVKNANRWVAIIAITLSGFMVSGRAQETPSGQIQDFARAELSRRDACQIMVIDHGTMVQNVGSTKLSSKINAGLPGRVDVETTNGSYDLFIDRPTGFLKTPKGGNADVVFNPSFSGRGKTNFLETPGDERVRIKNDGVTQLDVNLEVLKLTGAFPAGYYEAELTLRCE